jgi:hypothetical protein
MHLINVERLTEEEHRKLAAAALKARPTAQQRAEFRWLTRRYRRQHQRTAGMLSKQSAS